MDKPTQIKKDGKTLNFTYGPEHMRYKQVNGNVTTYYSNKLYEEEIDGTKTTWRAYIDDIAVISQTTNEGATIRYTHRDRLGSARIFSDHNGYATAQRNFDPFGKPRLASGDLKAYGNSKLDDLDKAKTRRGFTDHEHLDDVELIHMNGRVYDYNLGQFLSVDPLIQGFGNSQGINPYSYIMNNPLAGTDPTGYAIEEETKKIKVEVTGSRIKRTVGTRTTKTVTDDATGDVTHVQTVNQYKNGVTTISAVNYSNGAATSAAVAATNSKTGESGSAAFDIMSQTEVSKTQSAGFPSIGAVPGYSESGRNSWRKANDADYILAVDMHNHEFGYSPGDNGFWTPQLLKAQAMIESGGHRSEYLRDPLQVNRTFYNADGSERATDWVAQKAIRTELVSKTQTMLPFTSARNSLMWSRYKGWLHNASGAKYKFKGNFGALRDYNGNDDLDKTLNGRPAVHKIWYAESVLSLEGRMY